MDVIIGAPFVVVLLCTCVPPDDKRDEERDIAGREHEHGPREKSL